MKHSILIIDDSRSARRQLCEILKTSGLFLEFREAGDGMEGFRQLLDRPADVILCDLEMPGLDGGKFLQMLTAREELVNIPVIMLTGHADQEAKVRLLGQGASDYVTKPFDSAELLARVKVQLKIKTLQDSLRESNRRLQELATTDPLTGLANRRTLMSRLGQEFRRSQRNWHPLALIMIDLDKFKGINDSYGHLQGDRVLETVAGILRHHVRPYDVAARFGGEEFALLLPETTLDEAVKVGQRIRLAVADQAFSDVLASLRLTASLGVAVAPGNGISSGEELIRAADDALYRAKEAGRNRLETAEEQMPALPFPPLT